MGSRWSGVVVDSVDPARLARWWAEVLGYRILFEEPERVGIASDGHAPAVIFVPAVGEKAGKNRLHLDLEPDDETAEIERLVDMGARHVDLGHATHPGGVVLADPEGNEFSVLRRQRRIG
jgi:hypothetical protein